MTRPLFGSYGLQNKSERSFPNSVQRRHVVFGKRPPRASAPTSFAGEKLRGVCAELSVILADPAYPDQPLPVRLSVDGMTVEVGEIAQITVDPASGAFVLTQLQGLGDVVRTSDVDRLMDFVVAHVTRSETSAAHMSGLAYLEKSVGRSLQEVEQAFILATLRRCNGNRTHAARLLGISLRTLRNKLRSYWGHLLPQNLAQQGSEDKPLDRAHQPRSAVITLPTTTAQRIRRAATDENEGKS